MSSLREYLDKPTSRSRTYDDLPKLPEFDYENPALWFTIIEEIFKSFNVTEDSIRYAITLSAIPTSKLETVRDFLSYYNGEDKYKELKRRLISSVSEEERLRILFKNITMDNKLPSDVLKEMFNLAGRRFSEDLIKRLWVEKLLENINDIGELCELADRIYCNEQRRKSYRTSYPNPQRKHKPKHWDN